MSTKKYDYLVFIGRFAPFHFGHQSVLDAALTIADNVIVLIGSSNRPRSIRNPWTWEERASMIRQSQPYGEMHRIDTLPLNDFFYNEDAWIKEVQSLVQYSVNQTETHNPRYRGKRPRRLDEVKIGIIGYQKDKTSGYFPLFPQWDKVLVEATRDYTGEVVDATDIRRVMFEHGSDVTQNTHLSRDVQSIIDEFTDTPEYQELTKEYNIIRKYHEAWKAAPYAPTFVTTDVILEQSGHILMIVRGSSPGKGLWALPGGFLEQDEFIECGALRELVEETRIDCPTKVLRGNIVGRGVFDHPLRDPRGRTITHGFHIKLPPGPLPKVKGSDDAVRAEWIPFNEIDPTKIYGDHYDVICHFVDIT